MAYNSFDLANTSLVKTGNLTECYLPLWFYSSSSANGISDTTAGTSCYTKGTIGMNPPSNVATRLHTLNSNWSPSQKFSFEASTLTSGGTGYVALWDATSSSLVSGSQISTTSGTATIVRSGQFILIPGHIYCITGWTSSSSFGVKITKASLIAFLS